MCVCVSPQGCLVWCGVVWYGVVCVPHLALGLEAHHQVPVAPPNLMRQPPQRAEAPPRLQPQHLHHEEALVSGWWTSAPTRRWP
jgi:hypothetical protein